MKIRLDFVTNSSSSSFTIIGSEVSIKDINLADGCDYYGVGGYLSEGEDVFKLNEEMLSYLISHLTMANLTNDKDYDFLFYRSYFYIDEENDEVKLTLDMLSKKIPPTQKFGIINLDRDYCASDSVSDLMDRYDLGDD